jgi:hypothetical protein
MAFYEPQFQNWMKEEGITHCPTVRDTPQENGLAQVSQFQLNQIATVMLSNQNLPRFLWPLAIKYAADLKFRSPAKRLKGKTPYDIVQGTKPDVSRIIRFGTVVYYQNDHRLKSEKVIPRGLRGRFVGFIDGSNGSIIQVWKEVTREVIDERNFAVDEGFKPYDGHQFNDDELNFGEGEEAFQSYDQSLNPTPATGKSSRRTERQEATIPLVETPVNEQNLPRERDLDQPHEPSPTPEHQDKLTEPEEPTEPHEPTEPREPTEPQEPDPTEEEEDARHRRERTLSVIYVRPRTIENEAPVQDTEAASQPRRSTRSTKGHAASRLAAELGNGAETLRSATARSGVPEEHFHALYTAVLDEINHAHQSFYSHLDLRIYRR